MGKRNNDFHIEVSKLLKVSIGSDVSEKNTRTPQLTDGNGLVSWICVSNREDRTYALHVTNIQ